MSKGAPKLVKFDRWSITTESKKLVVKRWEHFSDGSKKLVRMDINRYRKYREQGRAVLEEFLNKENFRLFKHEEAKKNWKLKTTFISNKNFREGFLKYKISKTGNPVYAKKCVNMVGKYIIDFFLDVEKIYDYLEWVKPKNQTKLVDALLSRNKKIIKDGKLISYSTIKAIRENGNQFFEYLHYESEGEIPLLKFNFGSLTPAVKKRHEAQRKRLGGKRIERKEGLYIPRKDFDALYQAANEDIKGLIYLSYFYGLRAAEALAILPEDLRKDYLLVNKTQVDTKNRKELTKSRLDRKVFHMFTKNELLKVYQHIENIKIMHYTTYSKKWRKLCESLEMSYNIHSLRNTYCTNLLDNLRKFDIEATDVMDLMGHKDLETTLKYRRNSKTELDDTVWKPTG